MEVEGKKGIRQCISTADERDQQGVLLLPPSKNNSPKLKQSLLSKIISRKKKKLHDQTSQKLEDSPAAEKQYDVDCRAYQYPRLVQLARSRVDKAKLLRSIFVYILLATLECGSKFYTVCKGHISIFELDKVKSTQTDYDPRKFFWWEVIEIATDVCDLVKRLEHWMRENYWFKAFQHHKDLIVRFVLEPAEGLNIQADYALEVLGRFKQDKEDEMFASASLLDYWKPRNEDDRNRMLDLGDTLASHASLVASLHLPKKIQNAWEVSLTGYLFKYKLHSVQMTDSLKKRVLDEQKYRPGGTCCWPMTDGYMDLFRMLGGKNEGSDWREIFKEERRNRIYQDAASPPAILECGDKVFDV